MSSNNPLDIKLVEKKLQSLINTRESIQSISMWALSHKAQHEEIVSMWFQVLKTANIELRLCLFYVCNDIVQTCRREHAVVFKDAFKEVLKDAALLVRDASVRSNIKRIFKIWMERKIYDEVFVKELLATLNNTKVKSSLSSKLLAGFHPEKLKASLIEMTNFEDESEVQESKMFSRRIWSREEVNAQKHEMKNRSQGVEIVKEIKETRSEHEKFVSRLEKEKSRRKELILMLELGELFYDAQLGECNILTTAYKTYNAKLNAVKKRLRELKHPRDQDSEQLKRKRMMEKDGRTVKDSTDSSNGSSSGMICTHPPPPPIITPPPAPLRSELWSNPTTTTTDAQQQFQMINRPSKQQMNIEPKFYQQLLQEQYRTTSTMCQQQNQQPQQPSHSFFSTSSNIDECYETNRYEIGGEDGTPVYDEDALNSGNVTPVQDEDPADGYVPSKEQKRTYSDVEPSKVVSSGFPGKKSSSLSTPSHHGYPIQYVHPTLDITRPPPPFSLFYSPSPGSSGVADKEKQSILPQVMQMSSGIYPIVPISSSIASPTQFGMMPFVSASLPAQQQQQQLTLTQSNFSNLPVIGPPNPLVPQLTIPSPRLPFQKQVVSPPMIAPIQTLLQPKQKSTTSVNSMHDNQKSDKRSPSFSSPSHHERFEAGQSSSIVEVKGHGDSNFQPKGVSREEDATGKQRTRIRFNNLAHAKTLETRKSTDYNNHFD